ncbi:MAG: undecaprenyl-phosphate glucose phosphotransferase [Bradyrhizobiaceae bacterium]|nr:MAG: undecaprenyl-phosphate glucose phosphotransferase [Bradyrhizobiaceae bacterium]
MSLLTNNDPNLRLPIGGDKFADTSQNRASDGFGISISSLRYVSAAIDAGLIVAASLIGGAGYQLAVNASFGNLSALLGAGLIGSLLYVLIAHSIGFYSSPSLLSRKNDLRQVVAVWSLVSLLLAFLAFLFKVGADFSRGSLLCFAGLALLLVSVSRISVKKMITAAAADQKMRGRRAILLGSVDELSIVEEAGLLHSFGVSEVGRVELTGASNPDPADKSMPSVDAVLSMARERNADEIVLALPWSDTSTLELVRDRLRSSPLPVQLLPDRNIRSLIGNPSYTLKQSLAVEVQRAPLLRIEQMLKRLIDILGASLALLLLSPLMLISALAIKLDSPGPVFFRQRRIGFNSNQFVIFKFRTMSVMEDGPVIEHARPGDARVTMVGNLLRQSSIDELPQLFNVLAGQMSLVGPRPHAVAHDDHYGDLLSEYALRHHVKPGITGWAQVNGYRGQIVRVEQMKARVEHDLWYINNWSLLLDLKIAALTCFEVMRRRNAH